MATVSIFTLYNIEDKMMRDRKNLAHVYTTLEDKVYEAEQALRELEDLDPYGNNEDYGFNKRLNEAYEAYEVLVEEFKEVEVKYEGLLEAWEAWIKVREYYEYYDDMIDQVG